MAHKLLLADDSVTIQRVIELTFADEDVDVLAVGDGKQAIDRLESERPDIVLADVGMPERDGYEVASFIKSTPQFSHIPVLLLTGAFEPVDEARAKSVGCDGVLVKPFEPQMVITRVKDLLAGRRPGLWGGAPPPPTPFRAPAAEAVRASGEAAAQAPPGSLEDYFDRLDAAFGSMEMPGAADRQAARPAAEAPAGPSRIAEFPVPVRDGAAAPGDLGEALDGWDPDLAGDPGRAAAHADPPPAPPSPKPVAAPALQVVPAPAAASEPSAAATPAPEAPLPSLADAFVALLAAERSLPPPSAPAAPAIAEDLVEEIVQKVLARMTDRTVRQTVVDVAERLVREEIDRIKRS